MSHRIGCLFACLALIVASTARAEPSAHAEPGAHAAAGVDWSSLRGRVVYLDFWASWCVPCRQSFPWMESLQSTYEPQGLTVLAVNVDRERRAADRFLAQYPATFTVQFDPQGSLAEAFQVHGMPTSVLIDRQGKVRYTHIGFRPSDGADYERQVRELLEEK